MLSSYILVLSTKRLRRDLNPCYSTVTEWCHNQLGDGAKTRWICLQFNIPNITHYLYCCIHLNGGGEVGLEPTVFLCGWFTVSCPRRWTTPRIIIKLDSYPLEDDASGALIVPQVIYHLYKLPKIRTIFSFCSLTSDFSATRYLKYTFIFIYLL